ncbi:DUF7666 domain-containing protein [Frateuria aurantia]|uniref:DUF7666 domain-containing protein n=1 Tax=Frateuria aurantia (strain ATCC 33424 / DSM 6220 / KCTC 2777 / LMG 1558 / NBRC 3245 / NCIMB 13370) TaxID=767434 RepID=H8L639_FRAAD|nr:hypothetical protein [Frateuria aurantia]AFC85883.1 hypothetical protein Fraau_1460 [Frateuria aurantia DSM 6220]
MANEVIVAYKGFDKDLKCRDFQYEVGKEYVHEGEVKACNEGFHCCEYPLDVFGYYPPAGARFAVIEASGKVDRESDKLACEKIGIKAEIGLPGIIKAAIDFTFSRAKKADGDQSKDERGAASSTGDWGAASSTGDYGAASSTGYQGAASSTGDYGAASSTGDYGAASSTGNRGAASSTGNRGAASSTGDYGAASSTGDYGAASSTGDWGAASSTGDWGAAMASGYEGKVMGTDGNALFLVERNEDHEIIDVWAGVVGKDGIKPNVWYSLKDGRPVEI